MSIKIKKYILLIPTIAIMLINCICYGQVIATDDSIDYTQYFLDPPQDVIEYMDFTDVHNIDLFDFPDYSDYYFQVLTSYQNYENYTNGIIDYLDISFLVCDFTDFANFTSYDYHTCTPKIDYQLYRFNYYRDSGYELISSTADSKFFYFSPLSGAFGFNSSTFVDKLTDEVFKPTYYTFYIECEFFGLSGSGSALNVSVNFDPELTDTFTRRVNIDGQMVTLESLNFSVTNNSRFPIQYIVAIVRLGDSFYLYPDNSVSYPNGKVYSGDPTYVYVSDEWCYLPSGSSKKSVTSTYCPSSWHYVDSGDIDEVTVKFNQMQLTDWTEYDVLVYAVKNTQDSVCVIPYNVDSYQYNQDYVLNFAEAQLVYSSHFVCRNPAEFDPDSNSGSYAFNNSDSSLFNRANGYIDENGNVVIDRIDTDTLISGTDSWGSQFDKDAWDVYYDKQNTVSSDLNQLSNNFSSFFRFLNKIFGYFPKNYQSAVSLGLTSLVVLGIIKVVVK